MAERWHDRREWGKRVVKMKKEDRDRFQKLYIKRVRGERKAEKERVRRCCVDRIKRRSDKRLAKTATLRGMILFTYRVSIYRDRGTPAQTGSGIRAVRTAPRSLDCFSRPRDHRSNSRPRRGRAASPASTPCCLGRHTHHLQKQLPLVKYAQ